MTSALIDIQHPITICKASAGTGKTYTLAAYYVGLLLSGEDYRSILAITFTNKATAEMSERILGYLHAIANGEEKDFLEYAKRFMIRDYNVPDSVLRQRAEENFRRMLLDFDNVQIQTIDSFLQTLLSGLAGILQMSAGLTTELDVDHVISQAVDRFLTIEMTDEDRAILEKFLLLRLDEESPLDVHKNLCMMAKELYNESVQMLDGDNKILFDAKAIELRRERLLQQWADNPLLPQIRQALQRIEAVPIDESFGKQPSADLVALIHNTHDSLERPNKTKKEYLFRGLTDGQLLKAQEGWKNVPASVREAAVELTNLSRQCRTQYFTIQLTIALSHEMQLMSSLHRVIVEQLNEANCALLARTASTLSKALQKGDAEFILEKAGIRYRHILMDEFQDTSRMQWDVIRQLLMDVLATEGNTLLIVGDIKQSIYRWRNGDWHIMDGLGGEGINERFKSLTKNFRSSEEVVKFNLSLFQHIIDSEDDPLKRRIYGEDFELNKLEQFYQANKKKGGYVQFKAVPNATKEDLTFEMFDDIEDLLAKGAQPSDIMILVREKKEASLICDLHSSLSNHQSQITNHQYLSQTNMVSSDSFLLEASESVKMLIAGLKVLSKNDELAANQLIMLTQKPDIIEQMRQRISDKTPLYEAVSELVSLLLTDEEGQYKGSETAYVNNFLDRTRAYVSAYGSNVLDFLTYWEDTMSTKAIPTSSTNAIRIMTVHASKGLQSQTLFVPFCMWPKEAGRHPQKIWCKVAPEIGGEDYVPIQDGVGMAESAYRKEYEEEHINMRIDNLNMLYVALTRAEDNLYVSTAYSVGKDGKPGVCNHVGKYVKDFVGEDEYIAGSPVINPKSQINNQKSQIAELWANSDQVRFVQSNEGALYTEYGDEAYRRMARIEDGTLCHEIFAHLRKADELEAVLDMFETRGLIDSKEKREKLKTLISSAWEGNEQMRDWFTAPWELHLEEPIYINQTELRPDRVMINPNTNEAIVLDYKFGGWEDEYITQVKQYMEALRQMDHHPVRGFLWFARENRLRPVYE